MLEAAKRGHPEAQYRTTIRMPRDTNLACVSSSRQVEDDEPDVTAIRFLIDAKTPGACTSRTCPQCSNLSRHSIVRVEFSTVGQRYRRDVAHQPGGSDAHGTRQRDGTAAK